MLQEVIGHDIRLHEDTQAGRTDPVAPLFRQDDIVEEVGTRPAVRLGHSATQKALCAGLLPEGPRDDAVLLPLRDVGLHLFLEEPPRTVAKHRVVAVIYLSVVHVGPASINAVEYQRREKTRRRVAPSWHHWVNQRPMRSEEHTSELTSYMRLTYADF